jgi:hypothetical protein
MLPGAEIGETPPNADDFLFDRISAHSERRALFLPD